MTIFPLDPTNMVMSNISKDFLRPKRKQNEDDLLTAL